MRRFARCLPALIVALACSGSSYSEHQLSGRVLTDSDSLAIPVLILVVEDFLVVADLAADHPIHIFDASDGRLLQSIFRRGGGPGEVKAPWTLFRDRERACIWDPPLVRVTCVDPRSLVTDSGAQIGAPSPPGQPQATGFFLGLDVLNDSLFAAIGILEEGYVALLDRRTGNIVGTLGQSPLLNRPGVERMLLLNGEIRVHPSGTKMVVSQRHGGNLFLIGLDGSTQIVPGPDPFDPIEAQKAARRDEPEAYSRWGYVGIATTDQAIYGLYSGRVFVGSRSDNTNYGTTEVHEFGWDGQLKAVHALDAQGMALAVRGTTLYLLVHEPKPAIRVYELSD